MAKFQPKTQKTTLDVKSPTKLVNKSMVAGSHQEKVDSVKGGYHRRIKSFIGTDMEQMLKMKKRKELSKAAATAQNTRNVNTGWSTIYQQPLVSHDTVKQ